MKGLRKFSLALVAIVGIALAQIPFATPAHATADSLVVNSNGFFAKRAADGKYYPAKLCFSTDGSQELLPCGKMPGGYGIAPVVLDSSSTNITTSYVQLVASTSTESHWIHVQSGVAQPLQLGIGASASEVAVLAIPASGDSGGVNLYIPAGSRLAVKSLGSTGSTGLVIVNLLQ